MDTKDCLLSSEIDRGWVQYSTVERWVLALVMIDLVGVGIMECSALLVEADPSTQLGLSASDVASLDFSFVN